MTLLSREALAAAGYRVNEFLNDDIVKQALDALHNKYVAEFKAADSSEKRVTAWAQFRVLDDFQTALRAVVNAGEVATHEMLRIARVEESRKTGKPLPHE